MDAVEHAIARPLPEVIIDRRTGRKAFRQLPPLAAGAQHVSHRVEHFAHIGVARPSATARRRDHRCDKHPLGIGQVARIAIRTRLMLDTRLIGPHSNPLIGLPHTES
jgi:hypothetical protein